MKTVILMARQPGEFLSWQGLGVLVRFVSGPPLSISFPCTRAARYCRRSSWPWSVCLVRLVKDQHGYLVWNQLLLWVMPSLILDRG